MPPKGPETMAETTLVWSVANSVRHYCAPVTRPRLYTVSLCYLEVDIYVTDGLRECRRIISILCAWRHCQRTAHLRRTHARL